MVQSVGIACHGLLRGNAVPAADNGVLDGQNAENGDRALESQRVANASLNILRLR